MVVTKIQNFTNKRYQVWLDNEVAFVLYKGDLRRYKISEGAQLDEDTYELIQREVLSKRAEKRALHLLEQRDYTAAGLKRKLLEGGYSEENAETAIRQMESYHYLDDERYAAQFISCYAERKTKRAIIAKLREKGVAKEVIEAAYEKFEAEGNEIDEENLAKKLLLKRGYHGEQLEKRELDRHAAYLLRKGFSASDIYKAIYGLQEEYENGQISDN
ncbi:MAG: regulatory protein RecX [Lachnospiraceae bacterium]